MSLNHRGVINDGPSIDEMAWDHAGDGLENSTLLNRERDDLATTTTGGIHDFSRPAQYSEAVNQARLILHRLEEAENIIRDSILPYNEEADDSCGLLGFLACLQCHRWRFNIPKFITKNICIFSLILQTLNLIILTLIDIFPGQNKNRTIILSAVIMISLQLSHLVLVILTSVELARKLLSHSGNGFLLCQSYISTILLFSGIYTVTFRLNPKGWKFVDENINDPVQVVELWSKFLFLSVSSGTLCGSSSFLPKVWYNNLLVSIQMLLSFIYFASILGHSVRPTLKMMPTRLPTINGGQLRRDSCISQSSQPVVPDYGSISGR